MSDNVNKDIQNAIKDAKCSESTNEGNSTVNISSPRVLKHSLDQGEANIPRPTKIQESKEN